MPSAILRLPPGMEGRSFFPRQRNEVMPSGRHVDPAVPGAVGGHHLRLHPGLGEPQPPIATLRREGEEERGRRRTVRMCASPRSSAAVRVRAHQPRAAVTPAAAAGDEPSAISFFLAFSSLGWNRSQPSAPAQPVGPRGSSMFLAGSARRPPCPTRRAAGLRPADDRRAFAGRRPRARRGDCPSLSPRVCAWGRQRSCLAPLYSSLSSVIGSSRTRRPVA